MKYQPLPAEQGEQLRRLVADCLIQAGLHFPAQEKPGEEAREPKEGALELTVTVSAPGLGELPPIRLEGDREELRRSLLPAHRVLRSGGLVLDCRSKEALLDGEPLDLTPKEFQLLACLMKNRGLVLTRAQLLGAAWEMGFAGDTRTVDTHIKFLRRKLGPMGSRITTIRKVGYLFQVR